MFKIFLVEDEAPIRESIRDTIDWKAAGFEYIGDAPDGEVAVGAIRAMKPDIVITDIRMPFVDGLELSRIVRSEFPGTKIMILSGYDDFAYAQEAIRLGVSEYLLKPIIPSELMRAVNKVAFDLSREIRGESPGSAGGDTAESRRASFYNRLLDGTAPPSAMLSEAADLSIPLGDRCYVVCALKTEARDFDPAREAEFSDILSRKASESRAVFLKRSGDEYVIIFQGHDAAETESAAASALSGSVSATSCQPVKLYAGIGGVVERMHETARSFREAEIACNYALFTRASSPCLIRNVRNETSLPGPELSEQLGRALELMQCGNLSDARECASAVTKATAKGPSLHYAYIDILMTASRVLRDMDADPEEVLPELSHPGENAFAIGTPEQLEASIREICERVIQHRRDHLANRHRSLALAAKQFIDQNYADPALSLQKVAREARVSPTHFSAVFSREMGETFRNYLASVRMKHATRLLTATSMSAAEISEKVGYNDPQYFSRAFKRSIGMSIRAFRNKS
ncbi:MAG: response regulator [Synergistaceae bacterium]|jgi:two-component system response regulator YesN|nr:response regulator [Synergistaceae bacterium]